MENCCEKKTVRTAQEKKELHSRLNRIAGQISGIKKMIDDDKYCDDVLIQLSAVNKSIKGLANYILEKHMYGCVVRDVQNGDTSSIEEIITLFKRFQ